ncbi:hypothetical protein FCL47_21560 [Desulfopila sp. IMCC35006]|uniref:hypothetical protein n=1 Tax=Desulfopila sp. IMCC35006 TaxID=2569542 RepID=UPI0010ACA609|nr:hypothetical protein [Desulfopila sp. IMCC35006]TKB23635.1 hypothetical protein FCL47_21560 [Desulfopila sp. IMCC35006]
MAKLIKSFLGYCCAVVLLAACSSHSGKDDGLEAQAPFVPLSCIAVLPASTSADVDETISYEKAQTLEQGAAYATEVMQRVLQGKAKVRFVSSDQMMSLVPDISGGISGTVAALGQKLNCDGVLLTTVRQYRQRQGTDYSVDAPAAVDFSMVLRHSTDGNIVWSADFREEQESVLENLFSFGKAKSRGFKWVTVEYLMEQGIQDRLRNCPYLQ